jgi:hypothetical protein
MAQKKTKIKRLVKGMLKESNKNILRNLDKVLNSSSIDIDGWDENTNPMILPKCILTAILKNESQQYEAKGTSFEKQIKNEVKNIMYFI